MPVTLGEETHHAFSLENQPLPQEMIEQFIYPTEENPVDDEFTEYVPCFAIDNTEKFIAIVWWKATLLNYEYVLATFSDRGQLLQHAIIAFTRVTDGEIHRAVATIDEDHEIFIAEGRAPSDQAFDPGTSQMHTMEIMADGSIAVG